MTPKNKTAKEKELKKKNSTNEEREMQTGGKGFKDFALKQCKQRSRGGKARLAIAATSRRRTTELWMEVRAGRWLDVDAGEGNYGTAAAVSGVHGGG